jgi:exosortase A
MFMVAAVVSTWAVRESAAELFVLWRDSVEFGHGILVPPIIGYALWLDRERLAGFRPRLWLPGVIAVAACAALWVLSHKLSLAVGEQTAVMLLMPALGLVFLGPGLTRTLAFVFLFSFTASPLWYLVNPLLQDATTWATTKLVREFGIPLYREGNYLTIAYGRFFVAEMCSGLRYLLAALALSALFAFLNIRTARHAALMLLAGFTMSVLANWVRVVSIVIIGHVSKMQSPLVDDHLVFGWVLFALSMLPLLWIGYRLADMSERRLQAQQAVAGPGRRWRHWGVTQPSMARLAAASLCCCSLFLGAARLDVPADRNWVSRVAQAHEDVLSGLELPGWTRVPVEVDWAPRLRGAHAERVLGFRSGERSMALYVGMLAEQRQGQEIINAVNFPYNREGFKLAPQDRRGVSVDVGAGRRAHRSVIAPLDVNDPSRYRMVLNVHRVAARYSHGELVTKAMQLATLFGATPVAFEIVAAAPLSGSVDEVQEALAGFMVQALSGLEPALRRIEAVR